MRRAGRPLATGHGENGSLVAPPEPFNRLDGRPGRESNRAGVLGESRPGR